MAKSPKVLINYYFLLIILSAINLSTFAQSTPFDLFDEHCADCHSIGEGDMRGPDLLGVEKKYNQDWLVSFILSANTLIDSGDQQAVKIWEEYEKKNMPDTRLSESEIITLIEYIGSFNKSEPDIIISDSSTDNNLSVINGFSKSNENLKSKIDENETKLQDIEKKLDLILEFHKKSFSARITDEEINKGKELFEGEIPFTNNIPACVSCHNTIKIDTLNWNPSARDIAMSFSNENYIEMSDILVNPISDKMKEVFKEGKMTDDETFFITAYLQNLKKTKPEEIKKTRINLLVFILFFVIMSLSLFDLLITKKIKERRINVAVFIITALFVGNSIIVNARKLGLSQNYTPLQPIKFSHKIHIKENKIDCLFCHNSPEYSIESGVPTTNICMLCHNKIKSGKRSGEYEIKKIKESYENRKPIEWIKIHNLPDHVFFSHAQHVNVGKINCKTCHGEVEEMDITYQYSSLSMGWCIKCHRDKEIQFEENLYYSKHNQLKNELKSGKFTKVTADKIGANDCQKCHY
jgi:cytochrome c551/c552